jgi:hypothetical protein
VKKICLYLFLLIGLSIGIFALFHTSYALANFNSSELIDDYVFENTTTMSASQIDTFLNSFSGSCISTKNGFSTPDPTGWSASVSTNHGYTFGANVSAGQAIYDASQIYHVNPQVILTTMQKEQSIITGSAGCHFTNPSPGMACTYSGGGCVFIGMSYACPGGCNYSYNGFSLQLIAGAWLLRFAEQRAYGNLTSYAGHDPGDENIYYSGPLAATGWVLREASSETCPYPSSSNNTNSYCVYSDATYTPGDYSTITIDNGSTAALYYYTPFVSGNENFVNIFNRWFGSTLFPEPIGGILYYQTSTGEVFLANTDNNTIYYIPSWALLQDYGLARYQLMPATDQTIDQYSNGGTLTNLVWDNSGVYLVNNGIKYHVPSAQICTDWGFACFNDTSTLQLGAIFQEQYLQQGTNLYNLASYETVYYQAQNGEISPIANNTTLTDLGYAPNQALSLSSYNYSSIPLGPLIITTPTAIEFNGSSTVYYFDGTTYHIVPSTEIEQDWSIGSSNPIFTPPASANDTIPPTTGSNLAQWYTAPNGNDYLINNGQMILLNSSQQELWPSALYQFYATSLTQNLVPVTLGSFVWSNPYVYVLSGGEKHHVTTYSDYVALGITPQNVTSINPDIMTTVTQGLDALGNGKLIGITGSSEIYVVNNNQLLGIPDPATFNCYGFNWSDIYQYASNITTGYPIGGNLQLTQTPDGNYNYCENVYHLTITPNQAINFGLNTSLAQTISNQIAASFQPAINVTNFFYDIDNGEIYYGSGGALHYVSSYQSYVAYGGNQTNTKIVDSAFINDFTLAQNI